MKMLYYKNTWSCVNVSDMLQPSAKFQLSGGKLVLAAPFVSLAASIRTRALGNPVTISSMAHEMLGMTMKTFEEAGGLAVRMVAGDFLWIPDGYVIAEFAMADTDEISTSLSWVAMTNFHCTVDHIKSSIRDIQTLLVMCCQPSQKAFATSLKARVTELNLGTRILLPTKNIQITIDDYLLKKMIFLFVRITILFRYFPPQPLQAALAALQQLLDIKTGINTKEAP